MASGTGKVVSSVFSTKLLLTNRPLPYRVSHNLPLFRAPITPPKGGTRWRYTCTYAGIVIGVTKTTSLQADVDNVIKVRPDEVREEEDGTLSWFGAEVIGPTRKTRKLPSGSLSGRRKSCCVECTPVVPNPSGLWIPIKNVWNKCSNTE
ncbi:MAG: hypothetical protein Q7J68_07305 [Thermoplasmata archaeon]|nr:hypothetical protein [Thermoplasmata archaeon]